MEFSIDFTDPHAGATEEELNAIRRANELHAIREEIRSIERRVANTRSDTMRARYAKHLETLRKKQAALES